ncbi:MAG: thymidine phosphorylase [Clostridiales Family XIII bacterium]|jgi:pyrimidine-nucleoside phosphorylase|nr:thymidine phosphorylase [Clostridiales Family XIII bacterium]
MTMYDIILKKREGKALSKEEISYFVKGYTEGSIPDYQASALLMAVFFKGLSHDETFLLTDAMMRSGDIVDLSSIEGVKVDKHSTGGVGDKTTLIAGPLAAACGVSVAKMSGRGLGFTGGTVDKMESVPGMRTSLAAEEFISLVNRAKLAVIGQTGHIAPADKKLYALRDVTATVDNLSLIASSVMSKKLASGSDAFVLDVKCGSGAFMETIEEAKALGEIMVEIGAASGKKTIALVTNMDRPLGRGVGNGIEVMEAIETLKGTGPADITELSLRLASHMIFAGGAVASPDAGYEAAKRALSSGAGLDKLRALIEGQGGNPAVIDDFSLFPKAARSVVVRADTDGYIVGVAARDIGIASRRSGAGRETKDDAIDLSAGVVLHKTVGDFVKAGDSLAVVYGNDEARLHEAAAVAKAAFLTGPEKAAPTPLIHAVIAGF